MEITQRCLSLARLKSSWAEINKTPLTSTGVSSLMKSWLCPLGNSLVHCPFGLLALSFGKFFSVHHPLGHIYGAHWKAYSLVTLDVMMDKKF